ncbi:hypothetical protein PG999_005446 [Apiospora kogelbergensis]|uniref:Uncharacterized protein n=1 Tax=Apiospora kogelbergensis TaxID=1337665 RepID=A0AAW0R271_9PEZI
MAQLSNQKDDPSIQVPNSDWRCCFYPVEKVASLQETFHRQPGVHFMGYTSDFKFCRLAITPEGERNLGKDVQLEWGYHDQEVARPLQLVTNVYGKIEAKERALESFRQNAIRGIEKYGRQLGAVYHSQDQFELVRLQIEGSVLVSDIQGSSQDAQELFAQLVIQVCLYLEGATDYVRTTTAGQIITNCQRMVKTGLGIHDKAGERTKLLQLALVRRIFEMAGGRQAERLSWTSPPPPDHKATTSFQLLGSIVGMPESPIRKAFEVGTMLPLLSSCVAFQGKLLTVEELELRARDLQAKVLNLPPLVRNPPRRFEL